MRLLFAHERFGSLAGAEANAFITATALKELHHEVGILHGPSTGKGQAEWEKTFTRRFPLDGGDPAAAVRAALSAFQPDVVYVHKIADLEVIGALVDSGYPLVRMVHDHDIYCMRSYRYNFFTREICRRPAGLFCIVPCGASVARNHGAGFPLRFVSLRQKKKEIQLNRKFHRLVVVTEYMKEELLLNGFDPDQIEIHPPVPRMGDPGLTSNFSERNLIVYAGQIIRGKGVDVLLESLALLTVPFECVILGDGNHRSHCEKLASRLGLDGRVRFEGFVPQVELKNYYRECSVVALSSVWPEPIATVGMEVMRYGLPVVAFDAGGIKSWLINDYNGFLVPWMDRALFAAALQRLLTDKKLARQLGERGKAFVNERFNFPEYIRDLEIMFARVAREVRATA